MGINELIFVASLLTNAGFPATVTAEDSMDTDAEITVTHPLANGDTITVQVAAANALMVWTNNPANEDSMTLHGTARSMRELVKMVKAL